MKQKIVLTVLLYAFVANLANLWADSFRHEENVRKNAQARALKAEFASTDALTKWADAQLDSAQNLPELKAALKKINRKILNALPLN
ncbi:MAG: hypothetical protein HY579_08890 [Nitrospinae bacterium]|nr:hypothetical protein [Nitrospinota bacterium]